MPTVFSDGPYRIFFYSDEGTEPIHVHIEAAEKRAKFWIVPIELEWNDGFRSGELKTIQALLVDNYLRIVESWNAHFYV